MNLEHMNKDKTQRKPPAVDLNTMVYGKLPPQAPELEMIVLGAIMLERDAFEQASEVLSAGCFYLEKHQRVFGAMHRLSTNRDPIDIFTVTQELKKAGDLETVGGAYFVTSLTNAVVSAAHILSHSKIIYQLYVRREVIRIAGEAIGLAYSDESDAFDTLEAIEQQISALAVQQTGRKFLTLKEVAAESVARIHAIKESGNELTGVPSGLPQIDALTQGFQRTNFIILAARPGVGKSAVAGNLAMNAATHPDIPTGVAIFSLEMSAGQWADRMLSGSTRIALTNLKRGRIDDSEMKRLQEMALVNYEKTPIFFDDTPSLSIYQLKRKARVLVLKHKVGLLLVDYLQLMSGNRGRNENREQEVSQISREFKQLAKELNVPVIALSQLNRKGDEGKPRLGQLRESGAIEQDADDVFFLSPVADEEVEQDASLADSILFTIAKHRNGMLDELPLKFVKSIQKLMTEQEYERYITGRKPPTGQGGFIPFGDDQPF